MTVAAIAHSGLGRINRAPRWRSTTVAACFLLIATVLVRFPWFGDASYHEDESYYLVFAQAMHHGAMPYVDIWDRKPFGLFILYWLITFLPGSGVIAYQTVAGLFCFATACTIYRIVSRLHGGDRGAIAAGVVYLACGPVLLGAGGQTPIFYNLFITMAVLLLLSGEQRADFGSKIRRGVSAMLLCGLAITIKPTAIVESVYLGIVAAYSVLAHRDVPMARRVISIATFATAGALPTVLILAYFASAGAFDIYWFASVRSVGMKMPQLGEVTRGAIVYLFLLLLPLWIMAGVGMAALGSGWQDRAKRFILGWLLAAIGGFLLIPNFWDHYALPLLPPLAVVASVVFARPGTGNIWATMILFWAIIATGWPTASRKRQANADLARIAAVIDHERKGGCFYLYEGSPVIYAMTNACHVTSRLFPQHLSFLLESPAIGVDTAKEVKRIMARKPAIVALSSKPLVLPVNWKTRAILYRSLRADYRKIASLPLNETNRHRFFVDIWALGPDAPTGLR